MEENTNIYNSFPNWLDKYVVVQDKNGNINSLKNTQMSNLMNYYLEERTKRVKIHKALTNLKNRGLIQTF